MADLTLSSKEPTMTSRQIAELVESRHDSVKRTIERLAETGIIVRPPMVDEQSFDDIGRPRFTAVYQIKKRDSYIIVAQLSPEFTARLVDRWQELESSAATDPLAALPAEQRALVAVMVGQAEIKRIQEQHAVALENIERRVDESAQFHLMLARPANAESIVHIRERINKLHGLPARIVDTVMRQSLYAPKPAGMVKNTREEAQGSSYAVYWTKDITALFTRFVEECQQVTATQAMHPLIDGRFKLTKAGKGALVSGQEGSEK